MSNEKKENVFKRIINKFKFPKIKIPVPRFTIKKPRLKITIPQTNIPFKKIGIVVRDIVSSLLIVSGGIGLLVSYVNPLPIINKYYTTSELINQQIVLLYKNLEVAVGVSIALIFVGLLMHVTNFKTWAKNIKATPRVILNSPMTFYRKLKNFRDWLLAKIEHLNEESAKWRKAFTVMRSPYSLLRSLGFSPQMALGLLVTTSTVGTGVVVNETVLAEKSFAAGDSGIYAASVIGGGADLDIPTTYSDEYNTLRVDLGATPVKEISISDISVGTAFTNSALPNGQTTALQISGNPNAENFNPTRLEIGEFIFEKNRCKTLTLSDIKAHTLIVEGNASDGQSLAPSPGSARMRTVLGGHFTADKMETKGGLYDRVWIQAPTSGVNGQIGKLTVSNIVTKGGSCVLSKIDVGTMTVRLNTTGNGDGFATKDFQIETSVQVANLQMNDNVEVSISEPATQ
tara:strand:+ start:85 stop:1455 length:1371 start_codon:yes stop_codon:yes gene_type:complete